MILDMIHKMTSDHVNFIKNYTGRNNHLRLTGHHETSDPKQLSYSVGGRNTSIRIPHLTNNNNCGYFEDRRPGSDIDYYKTLSKYVDYLN